MGKDVNNFEFLGMTRIDNTFDNVSVIRATWKIDGHKGINLIHLTHELEDDPKLEKVIHSIYESEARYMWERDRWKIRLWWPVRDWLHGIKRQVKYGRN